MTTEHQDGSASGEHSEAEPRIVDKRKIDPETGEVRTGGSDAPESANGQAYTADSDGEDESAADSTDGPCAEADRLAAERLEQLQRLSVDFLNLQDQYTAYVKRSKVEAEAASKRGRESALEALIPVLDDIALARQHDELTGPFASIAEKLEQNLTHLGLVRYGEAGEEFDPEIHEALMHAVGEGVTVATVQQVLQPGYKAGERILRPARVAVVEPE